jgi:hypothetical protein
MARLRVFERLYSREKQCKSHRCVGLALAGNAASGVLSWQCVTFSLRRLAGSCLVVRHDGNRGRGGDIRPIAPVDAAALQW